MRNLVGGLISSEGVSVFCVFAFKVLRLSSGFGALGGAALHVKQSSHHPLNKIITYKSSKHLATIKK